ncbi:MAG: tetratricopeptide repeat protein [Bacteroidota bacterium]
MINRKQLIVKSIASAIFYSFLSSCSNSSEAFLEKGRELLKTGHSKEAIEMFNHAVDKDDENAEAFNARGAAFFEQKDYQSAQLDYEKAMKLRPEWYRPVFNRALLRIAKQDSEGALIDYNLAAKLDSTQSEIYLNRGTIFAENQKYNEAMSDFKMAVKLDSTNKNSWYNLGNIQFQLEDFDNSIISFKKTVQIDPNFGKAFYGLGIIYVNKEEKENGCINLKQANRLGYEPAKTALKVYCE